MRIAANKSKGVGVREIGRRWGTSSAYVSQFIKKVGAQPLPGGGYDVDQLTAMRARFTRVGTGQRKWNRHHPSDQIHTCIQCGGRYTPAGELRDGNAARDISRFCEDTCERDAEAGLTPAQTIKRLRAGYLEDGGSPRGFRNYLNYTTHYEKP
ncbi:MAG TPA: hypothetical protein VMI10_10625 [Terriglobales bacterium]|nr:hypothetical protein [Terriglobales bacterium]